MKKTTEVKVINRRLASDSFWRSPDIFERKFDGVVATLVSPTGDPIPPPDEPAPTLPGGLEVDVNEYIPCPPINTDECAELGGGDYLLGTSGVWTEELKDAGATWSYSISGVQMASPGTEQIYIYTEDYTYTFPLTLTVHGTLTSSNTLSGQVAPDLYFVFTDGTSPTAGAYKGVTLAMVGDTRSGHSGELFLRFRSSFAGSSGPNQVTFEVANSRISTGAATYNFNMILTFVNSSTSTIKVWLDGYPEPTAVSFGSVGLPTLSRFYLLWLGAFYGSSAVVDTLTLTGTPIIEDDYSGCSGSTTTVVATEDDSNYIVGAPINYVLDVWVDGFLYLPSQYTVGTNYITLNNPPIDFSPEVRIKYVIA